MISKYFKFTQITTPSAFSILVASASLVTAQTTPPHQDIAVKPLPDSDISKPSLIRDVALSSSQDSDISINAGDLLVKQTIGSNSTISPIDVPQESGSLGYSLSFTKVDWTFTQSSSREADSTNNSDNAASITAEANVTLANFTAVNFQNYYIDRDINIRILAGNLLVEETVISNLPIYIPQETGSLGYSLSFTKVDWTFAQSRSREADTRSREADSTDNSDSTASAEAEANNPLANFTAVNFQNYYIGDLTGPGGDANQFILRVAQPFKLFNVKWLGRLSLPVNTFPSPPDFDSKTGLGDLNLFTAALIDVGDPAISFGVGPLLTFPTATETNLGSDKWTIGVANVFFNGRSPKFQYGYLITYEHSFAGNSDRDTVSRGAFQPFGFYQLGKGWYLRGAPIWFFNFENGDFNIPLGLGAGKVIQTRKLVYNFFLEPQYIVASEGDGQPEWQLYFALNLQIKK